MTRPLLRPLLRSAEFAPATGTYFDQISRPFESYAEGLRSSLISHANTITGSHSSVATTYHVTSMEVISANLAIAAVSGGKALLTRLMPNRQPALTTTAKNLLKQFENEAQASVNTEREVQAWLHANKGAPLKPKIPGESILENAGNRDWVNLSKSLASQQQMKEPGTIIAGGSHNVPFRDAMHVVSEHGGCKEDWVKKSSSVFKAPDGKKVETHWVENQKTGLRVDFKSKIDDR